MHPNQDGVPFGSNNRGTMDCSAETEAHHYLELFAAFLALKSFLLNRRKMSVLLRIDVTAIAFLNRMGGTHSQELSDLAVIIWQWCLEREIIIHVEHLPGKDNIRADWESRYVRDSSDWMLERNIFLQLEARLGPFSIDLFASRTNTQLPIILQLAGRPSSAGCGRFVPTLEESSGRTVHVSTICLDTCCLEKLRLEQTRAVLIAPVWHNQLWYPCLLKNLTDYPILLPPGQNILIGPEGESHPLMLQGHLPLAAWPISEDLSALRDVRRELWGLSGNHGELQQSRPTLQPGGSGIAGALDGVLIPFQHH